MSDAADADAAGGKPADVAAAAAPVPPRRRTHLAYLGPGLVVFGLAVGAAGIWYMRTARPVPGDVIDTIPLSAPAGTKVVLRGERDGDHSFIEVYDGDTLRWSKFIPHYAGRAGRRAVGWGGSVVSVRVERDGREEVWALGLPDGTKAGELFLAPEHEPIPVQLAFEKPDEAAAPLTITDGNRTYEVVSGAGWHQLVGLDIQRGKALWKLELGPEDVTAVTLVGGQLDVFQPSEHRRVNPFSGKWYYPDAALSKPT